MHLKAPRIAAHILQRLFRAPPQQRLSAAGIGIHAGKVARTAGRDAAGDAHAVDRLKGLHQLQHAVAAAGAKIESLAARMREAPLPDRPHG